MKKLAFILFAFTIIFSSCSSKKSTINKGSSHQSSNSNTKPNKSKPSASGNDYVEKYKGIAISEMNKYGIPASIKLAQALLESGNGNSFLATEANNHFGIKCGGVWKGKSITRPDDKIDDCFRVYDNPEQSFRDHSEFLLRKRYSDLFSLDKNDYKGWAKGLKAAGYATNPKYPDLLIDMIERYELYKYDRTETVVEKEKREVVVEKEIVQNTVETPPAVKTEQIKSPVAMRIHEVKAKETVYSLSKLYGITVDQLTELNGLTDTNLAIGQLLVISK
ncbi:glucosaminidase domain-containing protein [Sphingobacterium sp. SRCM116780]|uniref:glucosaminidase domain-containing protein n=1 Tax=Sphingobacterium sp. SRCM116780 TaxID=2907623 RepID=UPI001F22B976|nr:glucosaminidase domain-containing protein [Sphingobacterium sp. SRCM116780]UIR55769.1 glucosaminidase domain-containing protein [Sphingobacterium sp. SRCM116780]